VAVQPAADDAVRGGWCQPPRPVCSAHWNHNLQARYQLCTFAGSRLIHRPRTPRQLRVDGWWNQPTPGSLARDQPELAVSVAQRRCLSLVIESFIVRFSAAATGLNDPIAELGNNT